MMPRSAAFTVENNFKNGLVTEASGLNFPESACTNTYNCVFNNDGSVDRRFGFDYETNYTTKNINRSNSVVVSYLWKNVAGNGDLSLLVVQVGATLYFYKVTGNSVSTGAVTSTVALTDFDASGAPDTNTLECQFSSGNGLMFVTHPYCDPFYVTWNTSTDTATGTAITLKIRDLQGDLADPNAVDTRPTATLAGLNVSHKYNLYNQGWIQPGAATTNLTAWDSARTDMPSNTDGMWAFKNSSDAFDTGTIANVIRGNSPAPKGHYILPLHNQNRDTASGLSGTTTQTTSYQRSSTSAFFAGRVFYSGINYSGFNSMIYFSQIIERTEQYGFCYQINDPTAEDVFELLPSDGGFISIPEAGTIFKLVAITGGLLVFAANGVWFISGSTGLGFTATDYVVNKISSIAPINASSFVDVGGLPAFWNAEGVYIIAGEGNSPGIQSLSDSRIRQFYAEIPLPSKTWAKGFYNPTAGVIQWLYRSTETSDVEDRYEYDRILNFSTLTGAFYPWTISESTVKVHSLVTLDASQGSLTVNGIVDSGGDTLIDASGNTLISYSLSGLSTNPVFVYLTSYANGSTFTFTFATEGSDTYVDWFQKDGVGVDYTSYFITGYKLRGEAMKKFQTNWINLYSKGCEETKFYIQALWDYANVGDTGRWSSSQLITNDDTQYDVIRHRRKIRGHGTAMQFKVTSLTGYPFHLVGWATMDTGNQLP